MRQTLDELTPPLSPTPCSTIRSDTPTTPAFPTGRFYAAPHAAHEPPCWDRKLSQPINLRNGRERSLVRRQGQHITPTSAERRSHFTTHLARLRKCYRIIKKPLRQEYTTLSCRTTYRRLRAQPDSQALFGPIHSRPRLAPFPRRKSLPLLLLMDLAERIPAESCLAGTSRSLEQLPDCLPAGGFSQTSLCSETSPPAWGEEVCAAISPSAQFWPKRWSLSLLPCFLNLSTWQCLPPAPTGLCPEIADNSLRISEAASPPPPNDRNDWPPDP